MTATILTEPAMSPFSGELDRVRTVLRSGGDKASTWLRDLQRKPPTRDTVRAILGQYYFVNRAFVLGIIGYGGRVATALRTGVGAPANMSPSHLEDVLATVVKISADECQAGGAHAGRNMHHNLLTRMGPKVGLEPPEFGRVRQSEPTQFLVGFITEEFGAADLFRGLALVSTVEGIALPMVKSLRALFGAFAPPEGMPFDAHELEHLDLHIALEAEHAEESSEIYEHLVLDDATLKQFTRTATGLYLHFGSFWNQFAAA